MSIYAARARYVPVEQGFNIKRAPIKPRAFVSEMERVFADGTPTGFLPLDLSEALGTAYPATTPFMRTRYARVRAGESLTCTLAASGEIWAVLRGAGRWCEAAKRLHGVQTTSLPFRAAWPRSGMPTRTRCSG